MKDELKNMHESFRAASKDVRSALGIPTDMDMENYKRLTDEDFDEMHKALGTDITLQYIRDMEARMNNVRKVK